MILKITFGKVIFYCSNISAKIFFQKGESSTKIQAHVRCLALISTSLMTSVVASALVDGKPKVLFIVK